MGGDGGSIPGRADVVRTAGMRFARNLGGMGYLPNTQVRAEQESYKKLEEKHLRVTRCALTQEELRPPLVGCRLGLLYNKDKILERLLKRGPKGATDGFDHVKARKDLKDLNVEFDFKMKRLICPISKVEVESATKTMFLWSCGCLFSTKAFNELRKSETGGESAQACPSCGKRYQQEDIIVVAPNEEEILKAKERLYHQSSREKKIRKSHAHKAEIKSSEIDESTRKYHDGKRIKVS